MNNTTSPDTPRPAAEPATLLRADALRAGFGPTTVLHDVSLQVRPRQVAAVLGLNGAGKSVTLQVVAGMLPAWSGRVTLDGRDITTATPEARVAAGMAHVTQGRQLFRGLSVEENLRLGAYALRRRDPSQYESVLSEVLQRFPRLADRRQQLAGTLSGGERAMLAVGRALMSRPSIILIDEPTAGLAPAVIDDLLDLLRGVADAGTALLLVEQNVTFALELADHVHIMRTGHIVHEAPVASLDRTRLIGELGIGRLLKVPGPVANDVPSSVDGPTGTGWDVLTGVDGNDHRDHQPDSKGQNMTTATSADGTRIHYEVAGNGDIPVILLHGLGDSTQGWAAQRDALAERCRLLLVDVRGHGKSDKPADGYSIAAMAADVQAAAEAAAFERAHVVGVSMGGAVAFELALSVPHLVASLVIVNSGPTAKVGGWKGRAMIGLRKLLARFLTPDKTAPAIAQRLFPDPDQADVRDELARRLSANDPNAYRRSLFALARYDRADDARQLDIPTLFIHSEHDYTPLVWRQPFVDAMRSARLVQIDGAHHAVPMERPDEFNAVLLDHLTSIPASTS